ncbi:MAG: putative signal transducing protein [Gaiellaceae bacterium]
MDRDEGKVVVICGVLRANGVPCAMRSTHASTEADFPGYYEVIVAESDLESARELLAAADSAFPE